jgi:hypothetical protein
MLNDQRKTKQFIEYFLFTIFFLSLVAIPVQIKAETITFRPYSYSDITGVTENPENAYDDAGNTYATVDAVTNANPSITFSWGEISGIYNNVLLNVKVFSKNFTNDKWGIKYSLDNEATWLTLKEMSSENTVSSLEIQKNIGSSIDPNIVKIGVYTDSKGKLDEGFINIYDIYLEATTEAPVPLNLKQSSLRFFESIGPESFYSINSGVPGVDEAKVIAIDGEYMYVAGFEPSGWRIEKRNQSDGELANSDTNNCLGEPYAILVNNGAIYIIGDDYTEGNYQWRIEKRNTSNLVLVPSFGIDGVVLSNPSESSDTAYDGVIVGDYIYIAGSDRSNGSGDSQWRIEVRSLADGSLQVGDGGIILSNPSSDDDIAFAIATYGSDLYIGGYDRIPKISTNKPGKDKKATSNAQWRLEKRPIDNISQIGQVVQVNPTDNSDAIKDMAIDNGFIYLAGYEEYGFFDTGWRIEKRNLSNLALDPSFDGDGVRIIDPGYNDSPESITIDDGYIYIAGFSADFGSGGDTAWRIEKWDKSTGGYGTEGYSIVHDIGSQNNDRAYGIAIDGSFMYIVGYEQSNLADWRIEKRNIGSGYLLEPLSDQNTPATLSPEQPFRLKMLVHAEGNSLPLNTGQFKLQVAEKASSGCGASSYVDLELSPNVDFYPILGFDGGQAIKTEEDPYNEGEITRYQSYKEDYPYTFSNNVSEISAGENGLWDFSLITNLTATGNYCFQIVKDDGSLLDGYLIYPEINVSP